MVWSSLFLNKKYARLQSILNQSGLFNNFIPEVALSLTKELLDFHLKIILW